MPRRRRCRRRPAPASRSARRSGQRGAARAPLGEALDIATRSGAEPVVVQARTELRAAGGRAHVRGVDALTPTEWRIAELAAGNRTNVQIAHDLYVTPKTVEWHLANVFRKLDIPGRGQLAGVLSQPVG